MHHIVMPSGSGVMKIYFSYGFVKYIVAVCHFM